MNQTEQDYELQILKTRVRKYLEERIPVTAECLSLLENHGEQVVWEVASYLYQQSGHTVDLNVVLELLESCIQRLKHQLAVKEECRAEQGCLQTKAHVQTSIEYTQKASEAEQIGTNIASLRSKFQGNEIKAQYFLKIRKIIVEQLCVEESEVTLDSHLLKHLHADQLDLVALLMALEAEFDIEIPDVEAEKPFRIKPFLNRNYIWEPGSFASVRKPRKSSFRNTGKKCIVKNLVETIYDATFSSQGIEVASSH